MRRRLAELCWPILLVLVAVPVFLLRVDGPDRVASGDSYWYMRQAQIFAGVDPATAASVAGRELCRDINRASVAQGGKDGCRTYAIVASPRYQAIFHSRPGYPLFAAPFVAALGAWTGMVAATLVLALIAMLLAYLAVWLATGLRLAGLVASAALLLLPSGFWMTRMLVEGGTLAGCFAVLLGAMLTWRGRRLGLAVAAAGLAWLFAVRSASGLAVALALLAASLVVAVPPRRPSRAAQIPSGSPGRYPGPEGPSGGPGRYPGAERLSGSPGRYPGPEYRPGLPLLTAGLAAVVLIGWAVVSSVWHLPSLNETIQDMATIHFKKPDVADPLGYLAHANVKFWRRWLSETAHDPGAMASVALAILVLAVRMRRAAVLWILVGLSGFALVVAHPLISQEPRLVNPMWIPVAVALGWAAALLLRRGGRTSGAAGHLPRRKKSGPDDGRGRPGETQGGLSGPGAEGGSLGPGSEGRDRGGSLGPGEGAEQGGRAVPPVGVAEQQG
ncbi:hypothetical protein [Actinoplanes sp. NPDC049265]|uniref:hypothetical protein n=1 Tax=Actinoplanes sp. NPDC049265 TaxID=3363902 RepID=UPI0037225E9D